MLTAKAKITDRQLEPDDETKFVVTVFNSNPIATAKSVKVSPRLDGGACKGVDLRPSELEFGTIGPNTRSTKEFLLQTKGAESRNYTVKFDMKFESSTPTHECDQEDFQVTPD